MSSPNIEQIRQQLVTEKDRLENLLGRTAKHLYRRDEPYDADFAEQAVETQNNEVVEQIDREAQVELEQIHKALDRIDHGEFGVCTNCGTTISEGRLKALPYAELCINCAK